MLVRKYFSIQHLVSAALFARRAAEIEACAERATIQMRDDHTAYVTGAIFAIVAFLEATINELFQDSTEPQPDGYAGSALDPGVRSMLAAMWKHDVPRTAQFSILRKYDIALTLAKADPLEKGKSPYADVQALIALRNSLMHYEPEWIVGGLSSDAEERGAHKLAARLMGKFEPNPLAFSMGPFYPNRCLSHGCAVWAVNSSILLVDIFFNRLGIEPHYKSALGAGKGSLALR